MNLSDAELVAAVLAGKTACFRTLYDRHYSLAVGIARSRLFDVHLSEDAAQEAFATAFRTLSTLRNHARFVQWLGTICRRAASRLASQRPNLQPLNDEALIDTALIDNEPFRGGLQQQLHESLEQLDETARELVMLHYFSHLTYEQIAAVVPLTPQAIHGRLQRARRTLREALQPKETTE